MPPPRFGLFTSLAVVSAICMCFVPNVPEEGEGEEKSVVNAVRNGSDEGEPGHEADDTTALLPPATKKIQRKWLQKALLAGRLFVRDRKIKLLLPLNAAFGFVAAFVNGYINGDITKVAVGENNIG